MPPRSSSSTASRSSIPSARASVPETTGRLPSRSPRRMAATSSRTRTSCVSAGASPASWRPHVCDASRAGGSVLRALTVRSSSPSSPSDPQRCASATAAPSSGPMPSRITLRMSTSSSSSPASACAASQASRPCECTKRPIGSALGRQAAAPRERRSRSVRHRGPCAGGVPGPRAMRPARRRLDRAASTLEAERLDREPRDGLARRQRHPQLAALDVDRHVLVAEARARAAPRAVPARGRERPGRCATTSAGSARAPDGDDARPVVVEHRAVGQERHRAADRSPRRTRGRDRRRRRRAASAQPRRRPSTRGPRSAARPRWPRSTSSRARQFALVGHRESQQLAGARGPGRTRCGASGAGGGREDAADDAGSRVEAARPRRRTPGAAGERGVDRRGQAGDVRLRARRASSDDEVVAGRRALRRGPGRARPGSRSQRLERTARARRPRPRVLSSGGRRRSARRGRAARARSSRPSPAPRRRELDASALPVARARLRDQRVGHVLDVRAVPRLRSAAPAWRLAAVHPVELRRRLRRQVHPGAASPTRSDRERSPANTPPGGVLHVAGTPSPGRRRRGSAASSPAAGSAGDSPPGRCARAGPGEAQLEQAVLVDVRDHQARPGAPDRGARRSGSARRRPRRPPAP